MSLNDSKIRNLKPSAKPFKVSDSHGLYLLVNPGGSRLWYLKYRINRKESRLGLGAYPDVSLADARQQRDGIRKLLAHNINPAQQRSAERSTSSPDKTFKYVALDWHKSNRTWSENHASRLLASMNNRAIPARLASRRATVPTSWQLPMPGQDGRSGVRKAPVCLR